MPRSKPEPAIHPFDTLHGTDTSGLIPGRVLVQGTSAKLEELTAYYAVAPSILHGLLDIWLHRTSPQPIEKTVFLDIGAGKGRAMLLASQLPFLRVEGVELNPVLADIARKNITLWHNDPLAETLSAPRLYLGDAAAHPLPLEPTLAFLFHPFELPLLRRFICHIETSQAAHSRPLDLLYANDEHDSFLDRHAAFERVWTGRVPMTSADHLADLAAIAEQKEYGSTGDEVCAIYRFTGRRTK